MYILTYLQLSYYWNPGHVRVPTRQAYSEINKNLLTKMRLSSFKTVYNDLAFSKRSSLKLFTDKKLNINK